MYDILTDILSSLRRPKQTSLHNIMINIWDESNGGGGGVPWLL